MPTQATSSALPCRGWQVAVAAAVSALFAFPLVVHGTPDVESYMLSIFSTVAFARELASGGDPWFAAAYGFGVPLPTSTWLILFPLAVPAALAGIDWLYAVLWIGGEFVFALYLLRLLMAFTDRPVVAVVLLLSAVLSFSNLGTTYVDDWPEAFLGWALLPACLWYIGQTLVNDSPASRLKSAAACAFVLGMFTRTTHHNEMVTFFSSLTPALALLLLSRPKRVLVVTAAAAVAVLASLDVLLPAVRGLLTGGMNPLTAPVAAANDAPTFGSYLSFLEPLRVVSTGGVAAATESVYDRVPFFGLPALLLAIGGAIRPFLSRDPVGRVPNDLARAVAVGFLACTALTLLPSWVVFNMPRMWTYRDGQTIAGLICAAIAIEAFRPRFRMLAIPILAVQTAQMALVAAPVIGDVVRDDELRLFGYSRQKPVFFERLRQAGVNENSRLVLAGELEELVRGSLAGLGVTAPTDFALEGIPIVNGWYRGARTPALGDASMDGRYGTYETIISWRDLRHLDAAALDVLGITHVAVLETDLSSVPFRDGLRPAGTFALPGGRTMVVLKNEDAWSRAVLLSADAAVPLAVRPGCPSRTIYCLDYAPLTSAFTANLPVDARGSSLRVMLPPDHAGGRIFFSVNAGMRPVARVDGMQRPVNVMLDTFAALDVEAGHHSVDLSVRWTPRIVLTLFGIGLVTACLVVAATPSRAQRQRPTSKTPAAPPVLAESEAATLSV